MINPQTMADGRRANQISTPSSIAFSHLTEHACKEFIRQTLTLRIFILVYQESCFVFVRSDRTEILYERALRPERSQPLLLL